MDFFVLPHISKLTPDGSVDGDTLVIGNSAQGINLYYRLRLKATNA
jgi:hypothetical protein